MIIGLLFYIQTIKRCITLYDHYKKLNYEITKSLAKKSFLEDELKNIEELITLSESCSLSHETQARFYFGLKRESENYISFESNDQEG